MGILFDETHASNEKVRLVHLRPSGQEGRDIWCISLRHSSGSLVKEELGHEASFSEWGLGRSTHDYRAAPGLQMDTVSQSLFRVQQRDNGRFESLPDEFSRKEISGHAVSADQELLEVPRQIEVRCLLLSFTARQMLLEEAEDGVRVRSVDVDLRSGDNSAGLLGDRRAL